MCRAAACAVCGKTTWAGCGQHVDSVRAGVPAGQWCDGQHSPEQAQQVPAAQRQPGLLGRLLGR